ncbi:polysaccharide lyase (plasmid) [Phyllobacterium zundukense]|uniref:Polysaccharide lyase n=1 Tax=Phyllobacterium zundukense TaxID=1867719 RepID=A0ACD4CZL4_9HYPH|nr:polysaccharide lyase [Phyllobacterium zundukense]UXN58967.1 polysaccharide lyase [Phyllobacterium zundukense]
MTGKIVAMALLAATLNLSDAAAVPGGDTLFDGFDGKDFAASGGLYYRKNFEQRAGSFEFQSDVKQTGTGALKLSVKPFCPNVKQNCSERAEIWEKTDRRVPYSEGVWYGFAVKFADPIPQGDHRYLIAQWKREIGPDAVGDFSPFLALRLNQGKLFATVETNYVAPSKAEGTSPVQACANNQTPVWFRADTNQMRALIATDENWTPQDGSQFNSCTDAITLTDHGNKLPSPGSGWIDFAIYTKPGPDGSGHIEIFANQKWIVTVKGHIGHGDGGLGRNQYFKFGPYRAADKTEWTLYYDNFRRSPRCEDVLGPGICPAP